MVCSAQTPPVCPWLLAPRSTEHVLCGCRVMAMSQEAVSASPAPQELCLGRKQAIN